MSQSSISQSYTGYRLNPLSWEDFYGIIKAIWTEQAFNPKEQNITIYKHSAEGKTSEVEQLAEIEKAFENENLLSVSIYNSSHIVAMPMIGYCMLTYGFDRSIKLIISSTDENFLDKILSLIKKEFPEQRISSFVNRPYISLLHIDDLRALQTTNFDLKRLIALCEEANICASQSCWLALSALNRIILDHIPPLFGCNDFVAVANNYGGNKKQSFKKIMAELNSFKSISDRNLHSQIGKVETIPTEQQVDFSKHIDVLLDEIIRVAS